MKLMSVLFFSLIYFQLARAEASPVALVQLIRGQASFNGVALKKGDLIQKSGSIVLGKKSFVKLQIEKWGNTLVLGPRSNMALDLSGKKQSRAYSLLKGACRWVTYLKGSPSKGVLYTKQASLGVRGTDYLVKTNPLLGESEIIVFDGKVLFTNNQKVEDHALVSKGQWGGLGGRFGTSIGQILDLPAPVLTRFGKMLKL